MGFGRWDDTDWKAHAAVVSNKTRAETFTSTGLKDALDPAKIKYRESRDSKENPNSTPVIIAVDVTGSMGALAEAIVKTDLGIIMKAIYDKKPVSDPHIMCMAIGDSNCDQAPLQVTQFEAEVAPITKQVMDIWLEGGGGGNNGESYALAWLFTSAKVKADGARKGRRGFLFTIGDENCLPTIDKQQAKKFLGVGAETDMSAKVLHDHLSKDWEIFHLIVETEATKRQDAIRNWRNMLTERAIVIPDHENLAAAIVSILQVVGGASKADVQRDWADNPVVVKVLNQMPALPAHGALAKT